MGAVSKNQPTRTSRRIPVVTPVEAGLPPVPHELMVVGRLVGTQGLKGELRVLPLSDFPERFTCPGPRWLRLGQAGERLVDLLAGRALPGKNLYAVRLAGIDRRDGAEALVGADLLVPEADRPVLKPGEFHLLDLVGLAIHQLSDQGDALEPPIGTVTNLIHAGNDLLEVERYLQKKPDATEHDQLQPAASSRRLLIPFVEAIVPVVNVEEGWIGITPPPGLLDL